MPGPRDDRTTRRGAPVASPPAARQVATLTVLWHPDPTRVGDLAAIDRRVKLSRVEPELAPPRGGPGAPLGDPHLSRRPVLALELTGPGATIARTGAADVRIDGAPLDREMAVTRESLDRGIVIEIEARLALLLHLRTPPAAGRGDHGLVGASAAIDRLRAAIDTAAEARAPVLIRGETGTGKELVARALHAASARRDGPFVAVNLAALPSSVGAASLFGHTKGAFTGAVAASPGYFRQAAAGTLFLDEVGAASLDVQAMLLRALEQHEIQPLGGPQPEPVDVRVIAATDADLEAQVAAGGFRDALLYRLAALSIRTPPLRERPDDVARLLVAFLRDELAAAGATDRLRPRAADEPLWLPAAFVAAACRDPWPGNVRALRNLCRRLAAGFKDVDAVSAEALAGELGDRDAAAPPVPRGASGPRPAIDDDRAIEALAAHGWQIGRAAEALGISRNTLYAAMARSGKAGKARDLDGDRIRAAVSRVGGDLERAAAELRVSVRALKLRMRELGLIT